MQHVPGLEFGGFHQPVRGNAACPGDSSWRRTDRQKAFCVSFMFRGKSSKELKLSFDSITGRNSRYADASAKIKGVFTDSWVSNICRNSGIETGNVFPIIHHNKITALKLAIQTVSFEIKDKLTQRALPNLLSRSLPISPESTCYLWQVEARGHKTCAALFFVLDSAVQILRIRSHNCTIVAEMALMKDGYIKGFSSKHWTIDKRLGEQRKYKNIQKPTHHHLHIKSEKVLSKPRWRTSRHATNPTRSRIINLPSPLVFTGL